MTAVAGRLPLGAVAHAGAVAHPLVRAAFYGFVASIPFELPRVALPADVPTLTAAVFLLTTVLSPAACWGRIPTPVRWFGAYLWIGAFAAVVNGIEHPKRLFDFGTWIIEMVLVFWAGSNLLRDARTRRATVVALVVACTARAAIQVLGIGAEAHAEWMGGARVTVFGQNANLSAMILAAGLAGALGMRTPTETGRGWSAWLAWSLAGLMGTAVVQTASRGGVLCAAVAVLPFLLQGRTVAARAGNVLVAVGTVTLLAWAVVQSTAMRGRFTRTFHEGHLAGREIIYPAALAMFAERPWLGWGPIENQYELMARTPSPYLEKPRDAHNLVLELITSAGVVGAVPFLMGLGLCARNAWRTRRGREGVVALAVFAALVPGLVSGTWIASKILWLALTLSWAAGEAVIREQRRAARPEGVCAV